MPRRRLPTRYPSRSWVNVPCRSCRRSLASPARRTGCVEGRSPGAPCRCRTKNRATCGERKARGRRGASSTRRSRLLSGEAGLWHRREGAANPVVPGRLSGLTHEGPAPTSAFSCKSFPAHAQLDVSLMMPDVDPNVRFDPHQPFEHAVERADRIGRNEDDVAIPSRLWLVLDPVSQRLVGEAEERAPGWSHPHILDGRPFEDGFGAELEHRGGERRVEKRIEVAEPTLSGSRVIRGAGQRVTDVVRERVVLVPCDGMLDVVPPLLEAGLPWLSLQVGHALWHEIEDANQGKLVTEQQHCVPPEADRISTSFREVHLRVRVGRHE